jgi:hypothetical protein
MGVRLRVMVRYTGPTYVPEGEEKSPQQLHQVSRRRPALSRGVFIQH